MKGYQIVVSAAQLGLGGGKAILMQFLSHLQKNVGNNHYDRFVHHSLTELPSIPGVTYHRLDVSHILERYYYYYDRKGYTEILKEQGIIPDLVISLQNIGVECLKQIVSSDREYAHEALGNYSGVKYLSEYDYETRAAEVIRLSETPASLFPTRNLTPTESSWNKFFELIAQKSVHP